MGGPKEKRHRQRGRERKKKREEEERHTWMKKKIRATNIEGDTEEKEMSEHSSQ